MYQTIRVSSCVSVQGEFVQMLENGDMLIRDGRTLYRGRPVGAHAPVPQGLLAGRHDGLYAGA